MAAPLAASIKATELSKRATGKTLYLIDEPRADSKSVTSFLAGAVSMG